MKNCRILSKNFSQIYPTSSDPPLTLILGSIEHLLKRQKENDKDRLIQAYETIQRSSRRILKLINQILEIRKIETGNLKLNLTRGDIVLFAGEIVGLFKDMANNQGKALNFQSNPQSLDILFDHDKIEKVLFNLLSNSFKHTQSGDRIMVSLIKKECDNPLNIMVGSANSFNVEFIVEDTGQGIPADDLKNIFNRFYQVKDPCFNREYYSTGIGLSYVKDLINCHNGEITVESQPGKGTRFTIIIPYIQANHQDKGENEKFQLKDYNPALLISPDLRLEAENMSRVTGILPVQDEESLIRKVDATGQNEKLMVLVVEDEPELRRFISEILAPDFDVMEAQDGLAGYNKAITFLF